MAILGALITNWVMKMNKKSLLWIIVTPVLLIIFAVTFGVTYYFPVFNEPACNNVNCTAGEESQILESSKIDPQDSSDTITSLNIDSMQERDFDILCNEVIAFSEKSSAQTNFCIEKECEAYKTLLSHSQDTLFFSFCYLYNHINDLSFDSNINKAHLSYLLIQDILIDDSFWQEMSRSFSHFESHSTQMLYIYRAIDDRYQNYGEKWLLETSPGVFQLIRATQYVPALRLTQTQCTGEVYDSAILHHAHEAFGWCFYDMEDIAKTMLTDGELPPPPANVANENTRWILTQQDTGIVTLSFIDLSNDFLIGRMIYRPSDSEMDDTIDYTDKYGTLIVEVFP